MRRFTYTDASGTTHLRSWALPLAVAAICVPVVLAMLVGMFAVEGTGGGLAAGAIAVTVLIVLATRARPGGAVEVAAHRDEGRRLLVLAAADVTPEAAQRIAEHAGRAEDVRLVVPLRSRRIDRWLSSEDSARDDAQAALAHSAGTLVAAGLPVSGSIGDSDPGQALEDELRAYPADEVVVLAVEGEDDPLEGLGDRLRLPVTRVES